MYPFLSKTILFVILSALVSLGIEKTIDTGLKKTEYKNFKEWNDLFNSRINADLLIVGSSRAFVHFSPTILDSGLHLNTYNLGIDGHRLLTQYDKLKAYLEHNKKPKYIILSLDIYMFERQPSLFDKYQFLPYLYDKNIQNIIKRQGEFNVTDQYIPLIKYNNQLPSIYVGLTTAIFNNQIKPNKYKGFQVRERKWDNSFSKFKTKNPDGLSVTVEKEIVKAFGDLLQYCKDNNIRTFLVYSPEYKEAQRLFKNREEVFSIFEAYSKNLNFPFLDYSNHWVCQSIDFFYNSQHLNFKGVQLFNNQLIQDITAHGYLTYSQNLE